jgi:hypothetical protein
MTGSRHNGVVRSVNKWWLIIGCGVVLMAAGLGTMNLPVLIVGVLLLLLGALAEGAEYLDLDLLRGRLLLKRETVEETMLRRALEKGISTDEARRIAAEAAAPVPEEGAQVSIGGSNQASALLSEGASVIFALSGEGKPNEELLAELFVEAQSKELLRAARLRDVVREAGYEKAGLDETLLHSEAGAHETIEITASTADDLLDAVGAVDITQRLLIYPRGRFAVQTYELQDGEVTIGRDESCDVVLHDRTVSDFHAVLRMTSNGEAKIIDNDSTNGVFVNKEKVGVRKLRSRDLIDIGGHTLLFVEPREVDDEDEVKAPN